MYLEEITEYISKEIEILKKLNKEEINKCIEVLVEIYKKDGNIYIFGNGGSAATASHFVCDFFKGVSEKLDKKFKFICLNDNTAMITAIANDIGYDYIFEFQLEGVLKENDLVIAISGSGNSINVIRAIDYAKKQGITTVGLTGYDGGKLIKLVDYSVHAPINNMQIAEDIHMILNHMMMSILSEKVKLELKHESSVI